MRGFLIFGTRSRNFSEKKEARKLLALAYYRLGMWDYALAVLSPFDDSFGIFWRWKIKKKTGLTSG